MAAGLTVVVHGESGVGKSWLGDTAPGPRLILDVEGGVDFTPSEKTVWSDLGGAPPEGESVVVRVRDLQTAQQAFQWLNSGKHQFRSVVIDSLSEMQKRAVDSIAGSSQMKTQDWGTLLRKMEGMVRAFRDLKGLGPVENIILVCGTKTEGETGRQRPMLQGQLGSTLPYYVDVVAYLAMEPSESEVGEYVRRARFQPVGNIVAKDRTNSLGAYMDNPSIPKMIAAASGTKEEN
jgi:hypothetical protein